MNSAQITIKKVGLLIALLLLILSYHQKSNAQESSTFSVAFENPYLASGWGLGTSIHYLNDTLYIFGGIVDTDAMGLGVMLKYDMQGNVLDTVTYDSHNPQRNVNIDYLFGGVEQVGDSFVMKYAEFYSDSDSASVSVDSLTMIDKFGDILWKKSLNSIEVGPEAIITKKVRSHPDGGFLINGTIADTSGTISITQVKGLLIRTDAEGEVLWHQRYEGLWRVEDLEVFPDGSTVIGGVQRFANPIGDEHVILRTDALGNEVWRHHFGGTGSNGGFVNLVRSNGHILGFSRELELPGFGFARGPFLIDVLEDDGPIDYTELEEFHVDYRDEMKHEMNAIEDSQGRVIMVGFNGDLNYEVPYFNAVHNGYLLALDADLDSLFSRQYRFHPPPTGSGGADHAIQDIIELPDGGFAMTGYAGRSHQDPDRPLVREIWVLRVDSMGCLEPGCHLVSGLQEQHIGLQGSLTLYPNPVPAGQPITIRFSPVVGYTMPYASEHTELLLYDGQGKLVHTQRLSPRGSEAGFELFLDLPQLSPGHYTLQWVSEGRNWYDGLQFIVE